MLRPIDDFLNGITMYKLVLYLLIVLIALAEVFSLLGLLSFSPLSLLISTFFLFFVGVLLNFVFSKVFEVTANTESTYISTLILALIITPIKNLHDLPFLFWATVWTIAGKYIVSYKNKHIFNPVALGVFIPYLFLGRAASWWVGTLPMMIPVLLGGLLIIRKISREKMVWAFLLSAILVILALNFSNGPDILVLMKKTFADTAILFFAFVMLTEPLSTPPTKNLRYIYAGLIGFLFPPQLHFGSVSLTPEIALLIGNVVSFVVSSKERLTLSLQEKTQIAPDTFDFIFNIPNKFNFTPGQYLEWTLAHPNVDSRGNRRYFTIASAPTEPNLRLGVKFYKEPSSYKKALLNLKKDDKILAASLAGDFTLPKDKTKKLVFLAGGIGITPFRSILKFLIDTNEKRDIVLFYSNKTQNEIVYKDILDQATIKLGIKVVYVLTEKIGRISEEMIQAEVKDYKDRIFYVSGPHSMVTSFGSILKNMKIPSSQIVIDYFPGFA